jgi:hypothetical protein
MNDPRYLHGTPLVAEGLGGRPGDLSYEAYTQFIKKVRSIATTFMLFSLTNSLCQAP